MFNDVIFYYIKKENILVLFIFIIFENIFIIECSNCREDSQISNTQCFKDVLIFNSLKFRGGHSSVNKNQDFILEFSVDQESGIREFYGLKENGRYLFQNESPTKRELTSKSYNGRNFVAKYESMNAFVSLKDDVNHDKQYLFSLSTYYCFIELYDFNQEDVQWKTIYTNDYFNSVIFSFRFSLLETLIDNKMTYYLVFSHQNEEEQKRRVFLNKKKCNFPI